MPEKMDPEVLDTVLRQTVGALESGKDQILQIAETAKEDHQALLLELHDLKSRIKKQAGEVDRLTAQERDARANLRRMHADLRSHTEADIADAHGNATAVFGDLRAAFEAEKGFRAQRESLERRLRRVDVLLRKAEALVAQVGIALGFLATNFEDLMGRLETAKQSRELGLHVIRAQEEERRRLAREIHDGPAQLLNSVVLRIDVCQRLFDTDLNRLREELQQLKDLVRLSLQDVRKIIFDLRPMALDDLGLVPALRAFLKDYQAKSGIETDMIVLGANERYDPAFEVAMFRLVQEALNNVQKHAQAQRVTVRVERVRHLLCLEVQDDGTGFELARVREVSGGKFGLVGMRERAELLGGTMDIQSARGEGARLLFNFPLSD